MPETYAYMSYRFETPGSIAAQALIPARAFAAPILAVYFQSRERCLSMGTDESRIGFYAMPYRHTIEIPRTSKILHEVCIDLLETPWL
jgi:hypothetical protein